MKFKPRGLPLRPISWPANLQRPPTSEVHSPTLPAPIPTTNRVDRRLDVSTQIRSNRSMGRLSVLVPILLAAPALADQPATSSPKAATDVPAKASEPLIPKRQINFETSAEEARM